MGTSLGVIIPSQTVKGMGWQRGDHVIFGYTNDNYLTLKRPSDKELRVIKQLKTDGDVVLRSDGTTEKIIDA